MALQRMNQKTYSEHWEKESTLFENKGIYKRLSEIAPNQDILEVGCGIGLTTQHLASTRRVLSIDNNIYLVKKAKQQLASDNLDADIIHTDIFELSDEFINAIKEFSPKGIACWFIGSHPDDIDNRTSRSMPLLERPKLYRERIEDLLLSKDICPPSVEWIHLANRVGVMATATESEIIEATDDDYSTNLFSSGEFKVVDVQIIDWDTSGSEFMYVQTHSRNLVPGQPIFKVMSILARRVGRNGS